jgi:hypothetical protein
MAKPTIVTRASKGSALTWTEGDANFTNLRDATITVTDGTSSTAIDLNGTITFTAGSGISVDEVSGTITISNTQSAGISDVVADTTPQLGGNLDVNGQSIVSVSNGDISITPNGTGKTKVTNLQYGEGATYSLGTTSGTITPNVANGNVQTITLNGNLTFSAFTSPVAGQSLTLIVKQDGTGSRTLTSTMLFAGASKTLSTAANSVDIISVYYDGTNYYASLAKGFA